MRSLQFCLAPSVKLALVLICVLCVGTVLPMWGQAVDTGTIVVNITDQSGAVVSGASVKITDPTTGVSRTGTSNDTGRYIFVSVPPGVYKVTVSKSGFATLQADKQEVTVGKTFTLNLALQVGGASTVVEVTATGTELQTADATVGQTITGDTLDALPTIGRDVSSFVTLQPGVAPDGSVAGANQDQNSFSLDGGNNSSDMDGTQNTYTASFAGDPTGGLINSLVTGTSPAGSPGGGGPTGVMPTPADSIEEFRVGTNNQTADFNSSAGAQIKLVTKRGTNVWHGTAYEYYLSNNWAANTFDNNFAGISRPDYHYNRFGGSAGGPLPIGDLLGGKTYIFANYEGFRWPNSATTKRITPSPDMQLGLITDVNSGIQYNLNPYDVTNAEGALVPANNGCSPANGFVSNICDPQNLGISPTMQAMWSVMPASNVGTACLGLSRCDGVNVQAFTSNYLLHWRDDFGVFRIDHDFGPKWHFYATYRYYHQARLTGDQIDIAGGTPQATAARPSVPWYATAAVTTTISSTLTNDFRYSFLRNYWRRESLGDPPQVDGLGGALEPEGESSTQVLAPLNLNTQSVRTRFWDGDDHMIRDDVSWIKGSHFITFGGTYQHNFNWHERTDNGGGINYQPVYRLGDGFGSLVNGMNMTGYKPSDVSSTSGWVRDYGIILGVPGITQVAYTRTGADLQLNPPNTPAFDKSTIPFYNLYVSDSWRVKPSFTFTFGLGWTLEMPPKEAQGKQIALVDPADNIVDTRAYLNQRAKSALNGEVYNPLVGFSTIGSVAGPPSNLYNPYYHSFSPRIAAAWNPKFDGGIMETIFGRNSTVIRGGYSILYGRLNGVDLVLVPLLGTGLIQAVQCISPAVDGSCAGASGTTPNNSFRIGPTANGFGGLVAPIPAGTPTLPQPDYPGVNAIAAGAGEGIDPNFRPSVNQQYDLTIQRQINNRMSIELGYIGRHMTHEFQPININSVPYMMTQGNQRFDNAYGQMVLQYCGGNAGMAGGGCAANVGAVTAQPFFETALAGTGYCTGFANCTQAVATYEGANIANAQVWSLWSDLDGGGATCDAGNLHTYGNGSTGPCGFNFARSMMNAPLGCVVGNEVGCSGQLTSGVGMNTSLGYGNYNAMFASYKMSAWHGLTLQSNFTWGKALGTGSQVQATSEYSISDPFNFSRNYGYQPWDRKILFNVFFTYTPQVFKDQHGIEGRLLGGWTFAPVIDIGSGLPLGIYASGGAYFNTVYNGGQSFGGMDGSNFGDYENAVQICGGKLSTSRHNLPPAAFGDSGYGPELYSDPEAVYNCFRNPVLGVDNGRNGGPGNFRGQPFWNVDFGIKKNLMLTERFGAELDWTITNVFNHNQLFDPYNWLTDPDDFGALEGEVNNPRRMEIAFRFRF